MEETISIKYDRENEEFYIDKGNGQKEVIENPEYIELLRELLNIE